MPVWTYFRLLDEEHKGLVVRVKGRDQEVYDEVRKEWRPTGIMLHYFSDESDRYDMYEEFAEKDLPAIM